MGAKAAAIADDIAYNSHDIDDGLRAGLFRLEDVRAAVPLVDALLGDLEARHPSLEPTRTIHELVRRVITLFVEDVLAELPDGKTIGGDFNNEGNEVLKDTRWVAQYEPNMGIGILGYTPKVASGNGSHTMIWDLERYHKFYTRRVGLPETFEAGQKLDYTMIVRGVPDESGDWEATRAAAEDLKRRYPPVNDED